MVRCSRRSVVWAGCLAAGLLGLAGCTSAREYFHNGLKVGPNYARPAAPVAEHWIDAADVRVRRDAEVPCRWWQVFGDPTLNELVHGAYQQNITLRQAGFRVLEARAQAGIARGEFFPQSQDNFGSYTRRGSNGGFSDQWSYGFSLAWELDFWGRLRRAIAAADDLLDASVEDYDDVLVTLIGDVANNYVAIRTYQERLRLLQANIEIQKGILQVGEVKLGIGAAVTSIDVEQLRSNLLQNQAQIEQLHVNLRLATNRLCILLGIPPRDLMPELGTTPIPVAPPDVVVGIPADLLRRRPDVRRAEREAAAQGEQIGIAVADLYPAFSVNGTLNYQAQNFSDLFTSQSFNGSVGPSFRWNILNYGRIVNGIRVQNARFDETVAAYQSTVLNAAEEAENGLVAFLRAQKRAQLLQQSADAASKAVLAIRERLDANVINFNQYAVIQQSLIQQQDQWAQSRGEIAVGLIQVYRALGGGWEIRLPGPTAVAAEAIPAPTPAPAVQPLPGT